MQSKGIKSVAARVVNINTLNPLLTHELLSEEIIKSFKKFHNVDDILIERVAESLTLGSNKEVAANMATLLDWDWRFGKEPEFSHHLETRFAWGLIDLYMVVKDGKVLSVTLNTDALDVELVVSIQAHLLHTEYSPRKLAEALAKAKEALGENAAAAANIDEFSEWLVNNL
jgi:lipoate-protein ligase A